MKKTKMMYEVLIGKEDAKLVVLAEFANACDAEYFAEHCRNEERYGKGYTYKWQSKDFKMYGYKTKL